MVKRASDRVITGVGTALTGSTLARFRSVAVKAVIATVEIIRRVDAAKNRITDVIRTRITVVAGRILRCMNTGVI